MTYILKIRKEKVSFINNGDTSEEIPLTDISIDFEDGVAKASYVWQAFLDHQIPGRPNRFSIARKLAKHKPKINKY